MLKANADRSVVQFNNEAQAAVLSSSVQAFGNGMNLARYAFYQKLGPRIASILTSDQIDGLGGIFLPYLPKGRRWPNEKRH